MKTTVKTIAIASIIALGTASAFARPANGNKNNPQNKTVTTTTVTTTKTVKEETKKVASNKQAKPNPKKEASHMRPNENKRRHVVKHEGPKHEPRPVAKQEGPKAPKPAVKPAPVCHTTVVKTFEVAKPAKPVTVVKTVEAKPATVEIDGKSLAAGAIIGGILALTAVAAAN